MSMQKWEGSTIWVTSRSARFGPTCPPYISQGARNGNVCIPSPCHLISWQEAHITHAARRLPSLSTAPQQRAGSSRFWDLTRRSLYENAHIYISALTHFPHAGDVLSLPEETWCHMFQVVNWVTALRDFNPLALNSKTVQSIRSVTYIVQACPVMDDHYAQKYLRGASSYIHAVQ